jgi:hypothetical protein
VSAAQAVLDGAPRVEPPAMGPREVSRFLDENEAGFMP